MKFLLACCLSMIYLCGIAQPTETSPAPPNILLIMCDDLGWGDTGFNGNTRIQTPHLDQLAGKGIIFNRFYSAGPVCSPTRASCITGRNPWRMEIPTANSGHMKPQEITLPELLREQGYATGHFGKWHLGTLTATMKDANRGKPRDYSHYSLPTQNGYEEYFCTESKVPTWDPLFKPTQFDTSKGESLRYGWAAVEGNSRPVATYGTWYWKGPEQMELNNIEGDNSRVIMDRVIPFIGKSVQAGRPFFSTVWLHTPHLPVVAAAAYRNRYPDLSDKEQLYYGSITAMDDQIGRLWAELEKMGVAENTMIWFCSDNGPEIKTPGSAGPFRARKRSLYEGGVRVPAFCVWPTTITAGTTTDFPAVTSDYLPTLLSVLGTSYPDPVRPIDGQDISDILSGADRKRNKAIGFQHPRGRISWVSDIYKLVRDNEQAPYELFDLVNDPGEQNNLAASEPKLVTTMKASMHAWEESCKKSAAGEDY